MIRDFFFLWGVVFVYVLTRFFALFLLFSLAFLGFESVHLLGFSFFFFFVSPGFFFFLFYFIGFESVHLLGFSFFLFFVSPGVFFFIGLERVCVFGGG